jgi:predicted ABC-type ATPase
MLAEMRRAAASRVDFAFESTLSGLGCARYLEQWQLAGYHIEIVYLRLASPKIALSRIRARVRQGGHDVPQVDVVRRFARGWRNFEGMYRALADKWAVYDNSGALPTLLEKGP